MADADVRKETFSVSGMDHCERAVERRIDDSGREERSESVLSKERRARRVGGRSGEEGG